MALQVFTEHIQLVSFSHLHRLALTMSSNIQLVVLITLLGLVQTRTIFQKLQVQPLIPVCRQVLVTQSLKASFPALLVPLSSILLTSDLSKVRISTTTLNLDQGHLELVARMPFNLWTQASYSTTGTGGQ